MYNDTNDKKLTSAFVLSFISKTIEKITENLRNDLGKINIVYAGGVMSNKIIKNSLLSKFNNVYFAEPQFSTDNACGVALLARKSYLN